MIDLKNYKKKIWSQKGEDGVIEKTIYYDTNLLQKSLDKMYKYCGNDVAILEDLYLELRPWIKSHPNIALYTDGKEPRCSKCGNTDIKWNGKFYYTPAGRYRVLFCDNCKSYTRLRFSDLTKEQREHLLRSVAR